MNAAPDPDAIHPLRREIEARDLEWFAQHPGREYRIRPPEPGEHELNGLPPVPAGMAPYIGIRRLAFDTQHALLLRVAFMLPQVLTMGGSDTAARVHYAEARGRTAMAYEEELRVRVELVSQVYLSTLQGLWARFCQGAPLD